MYYPTDAQTCAQTRAYEWEREVATMQLAEAAFGTPQTSAAAGNQMGKLLVEVVTSVWAALSHGKRTRTA